MTVIIPAGFCQIRHQFSSDTLHKGFAYTILGGDTNESAPSDIAVAYAAAYTEHLLPLLRDDFILDLVEVVTVNTSGLATVGLAGEFSTSGADPQVSLLCSKRTAVRGARAKGRSYWPGMVGEATYDEFGNMSQTNLAAFQDAFDAWKEQLVTAGFNEVILQNEEGQSPPLSPPPTVLRQVVDVRAATQRRRLR